MLEKYMESYSSPCFWVNGVSQKVKQNVSVAATANL